MLNYNQRKLITLNAAEDAEQLKLSFTLGLRPPEQLARQAGFPSSDKTRHDSPVPTLQGPCGRSPKRRGSLRFLPPLEVRSI